MSPPLSSFFQSPLFVFQSPLPPPSPPLSLSPSLTFAPDYKTQSVRPILPSVIALPTSSGRVLCPAQHKGVNVTAHLKAQSFGC